MDRELARPEIAYNIGLEGHTETYHDPTGPFRVRWVPGRSSRHHPGRDSDQVAFVERRIEELRAKMDKGGPREAALRALIYVGMPEKGPDEREFEMLRRIRPQHGTEKSLAEFKQDLREQYYMLRIDESRAIELIPKLLQGHENEGPQLLEYIRQIVYADGSLGEEGQRRLEQMETLFTQQVSA